jgi:hypothetical protein
VNRSELKSIVKECLLEILMEGVAAKPSKPAVVESKQRAVQKQNDKAQPVKNRPGLDLILHGAPSKSNQQAAPRGYDPLASVAKDLAGGNDVMASIFADTAKTTLAQQGINESSRPSNPVVDTGIDPSTMFASSKNWEFLAFSGKNSNE